jgi:5-methylcytosine-specific restriction endonuclease McrA
VARYKFDKIFEANFIEVCNSSISMNQAAIKLGMNYKTLCFHAKRLNCFKANQSGKGIVKVVKHNVTSLTEIFEGKANYQSYKLKKRLLKENIKNHQCESCGLDKWLENPIPLELHHIDGNRYNNSLENLSLLCPNCHALTENYRAKNISNLSASMETLRVESLKFGEALSET